MSKEPIDETIRVRARRDAKPPHEVTMCFYRNQIRADGTVECEQAIDVFSNPIEWQVVDALAKDFPAITLPVTKEDWLTVVGEKAEVDRDDDKRIEEEGRAQSRLGRALNSLTDDERKELLAKAKILDKTVRVTVGRSPLSPHLLRLYLWRKRQLPDGKVIEEQADKIVVPDDGWLRTDGFRFGVDAIPGAEPKSEPGCGELNMVELDTRHFVADRDNEAHRMEVLVGKAIEDYRYRVARLKERAEDLVEFLS